MGGGAGGGNDSFKTSQAQSIYNQDAAQIQQQLNMVNQVTPYGSVTYAPSGTWGTSTAGFPIPHYTATTKLSPEMQALVDNGIMNATDASKIEGQLLANAGANISKPLDLSYGETEARLNELGRKTIDPQYSEAQEQLNQELYNKGIAPGSELWETSQRQFGDEKSRAYNDLYLRGHSQAVSDIMNEYNSPINTLSALKASSQVAQPGVGALAPTPQTQVQAPDYEGTVQANNKLQAESKNAALGGLFGLGSSALGLAGKFIGASDRDMKTDIQKLGKDKESGLDMYAYRYKGDPKNTTKVVGPMADEVQKKYPGLVREIGGKKVVLGLGGRSFGIGGAM